MGLSLSRLCRPAWRDKPLSEALSSKSLLDLWDQAMCFLDSIEIMLNWFQNPSNDCNLFSFKEYSKGLGFKRLNNVLLWGFWLMRKLSYRSDAFWIFRYHFRRKPGAVLIPPLKVLMFVPYAIGPCEISWFDPIS